MNNNDHSNTEIRDYHYGVVGGSALRVRRLYTEFPFPYRRKSRLQIFTNIYQKLGEFGMKQHE